MMRSSVRSLRGVPACALVPPSLRGKRWSRVYYGDGYLQLRVHFGPFSVFVQADCNYRETRRWRWLWRIDAFGTSGVFGKDYASSFAVAAQQVNRRLDSIERDLRKRGAR